MIKLNPAMEDFMADASLYSLYNILPVGWKTIKDETTKMRKPLCAKERRKQQIEIMKNGMSKGDIATLIFEREAIGPFRARKVFTFGDGRVLTIERVYRSWELEEFWSPKEVAARCIRHDSVLVRSGEVGAPVRASEETIPASTPPSRSSTSNSANSSHSSSHSRKQAWWRWSVLKSSCIPDMTEVAGKLSRRPRPQQGCLTKQESIQRFWRIAQEEQQHLTLMGIAQDS